MVLWSFKYKDMGRQIKNHKTGELHYYIQWLLGMMQLAASIWWDYGVFLLYYWWFIYRCCVPFKTFLVDCPASHVWLPDQLISVGITRWQNQTWRSEWKPAPFDPCLWLVSGSRKDGGPTKSHMGRAAWWIFTLPDVKYQLSRTLLHDLHIYMILQYITIYYM